MKELTASQLEAISGAGWLKNCMATVSGKIGNGIWVTTGDVLTVELPVVGTFNMADLSPSLGRNIGNAIGSTVGGAIENILGSIPVVGSLCKKLLGN